MAKVGRPPKLTAQHKIDGTYREDRHGGRVEAAIGLPSAPPWLDPTALSVWRHILPLLVKQSCAAEIDTEMLGLFCHHYSTFLRMKELIEVAEPATREWQILNSAINQASGHIEKLSGRFGLTPADRAGIKIEPPGKENADHSRFFASDN